MPEAKASLVVCIEFGFSGLSKGCRRKACFRPVQVRSALKFFTTANEVVGFMINQYFSD